MISVNSGQETKGVGLMFMACFSVGIVETCSLALGMQSRSNKHWTTADRAIAPLALPSEDIGAALGALGSIRSGGAAVATAIYVTVLTNKLTKFVPEYVTPAAINAGLPQTSLTDLFTGLTAGDLTTVPGITPAIIAAVGAADAMAAADAFRYVWYCVIAFCIVSATNALHPRHTKLTHHPGCCNRRVSNRQLRRVSDRHC